MGKLLGRFDDFLIECWEREAIKADKYRSIGAVDVWIELPTSIVVVRGCGPFFVLAS